MKIISWNVNGLRAVLSKDVHGNLSIQTTYNAVNTLEKLIHDEDPDIIALQETKCPDDLISKLNIFTQFKFAMIYASNARKGYSGVAILSKTLPIVRERDEFPENNEGRLICCEYPKFFVMNAYVPNSKTDLSRLNYRVNVWEPAVRKYIQTLQATKPVIYLGDLNVAPTELDIHSTKGKAKAHGFTLEERTAFNTLLSECGMLDAYRVLHPEKREYTWFSPFAKSRENNKGWFIDKILVSSAFKNKISSVDILHKYAGSDHIPIAMTIQ